MIKQTTRVSLLLLSISLIGCWVLKGQNKKLFKKHDYILFKEGFIDSSRLIKYNGVYINKNDSVLGFMRFFPDGKVVIGECYNYHQLTDLNDCFDNETKLSLYGYYMVRNHTLFAEVDDNVALSSGIWIDLHTIKGDTITALYGFNRSKIKNKNLRILPSPNDKGTIHYGGKLVFVPFKLTTRIKLNW